MPKLPDDDNVQPRLQEEPPVLSLSSDGFRSALAGSCSACGCINRTQSIWCAHCRAPLEINRNALRAVESSAKSLQERLENRAKLYRDVLADQERLQREQHVSQTELQPIRLFYDQRLHDVRSQLESLRSQREQDKVYEQIVSAAQAGNLDLARQKLAVEQRKWPDIAYLRELYEEIDRRYRQVEAAHRAKQQAQELLALAQELIQRQDFEGARIRLLSASELQPDDRLIEDAIQHVEQLLREKRAKELPSAAGPSPPGVDGAVENAGSITASLSSFSPTIMESSPATTTLTTRLVEIEPTPSPATQVELSSSVPTFADEDETPSAAQRHLEALSTWTNLVKPFLMDNVGWFVGSFLVIAGFVVLIVTFWNTIEQNQIMMHSLVFFSLFSATGLFFAAAYFMRLKYPQLESSSDVLLVIVALLIPLVFAAAILTALLPATVAGDSLVQVGQAVEL